MYLVTWYWLRKVTGLFLAEAVEELSGDFLYVANSEYKSYIENSSI